MRLKYKILEKHEEPIFALDEIKNFLRIAHDYDDSLIKNLIQAAIDYAESFTGKFIHIREVECSAFRAGKELCLKYSPICEIISVRNLKKNKLEDIGEAFIAIKKEQSLLVVAPSFIGHKLIIKYSCGYGQALPQTIRIGMLKHISAMYELNIDSLCPVDEIRNFYLPYRKLKI